MCLDGFLKHDRHAAPSADQVYSLPLVEDIAQWGAGGQVVMWFARDKVARRDMYLSSIQGETMLRTCATRFN